MYKDFVTSSFREPREQMWHTNTLQHWIGKHGMESDGKHCVHDVPQLRRAKYNAVNYGSVNILTLLIYSGCRSLIKSVSDATNRCRKFVYVYILLYWLTYHYRPIRLLRNHTANFCSDQILFQIWCTRIMVGQCTTQRCQKMAAVTGQQLDWQNVTTITITDQSS